MVGITPIPVILSGDKNWHIWIQLLRTRAHESDIWRYIDPNTPESSITPLIEPTAPTFEDVHTPASADSIVKLSDLSAIEHTYFQSLKVDYREEMKLFRDKTKALANMCSVIQASIEEHLTAHTLSCDSARAMLLNLKAEYCANPAVRERQLLEEYRQCKELSDSESLDKWLLNWEIAYTKCKEIKASEVEGTKPFFDFIHALKNRLPNFHATWFFRLIRVEDPATLRIRDMIQELKDYIRDGGLIEQTARNTAFPSFQGQGQTNSSNSSFKKRHIPQKTAPKCICGLNHWFNECPYLLPSARQQGWKPEPHIQRVVDNTLLDSTIKQKVEHSLQRSRERNSNKPQSTQSAALCAYSTLHAYTAQKDQPSDQWDLYNSFILDSGATTHICHTLNRFRNFKAIEGEGLITASAPLQIQGYGDVDITIQTSTGSKKVTLLNTAYIPNCTINMVSSHRLIKAGVYWDQAMNKLIQHGAVWGYLTLRNNLYVVEYNQPTSQQVAFISKNFKAPPPPHQFRKSTSPKPIQEVSTYTLHRRFAHAGATAIKHIPEALHGIKLSNKGEHFNCEVCSVVKATKLIHREPVPRPNAPYELVAFDLIELKPVNQDAGYGKYALHFYCRYSGMNHVYILPTKSESILFNTIRQFCAYTLKRWNLPVRIFHTDGERGVGSTIQNWLAHQGIGLNTSPPHTQDQNGGAERSGGVIIMRARAIHTDSRLPGYMWPETLTAAGYILNRTPRQRLGWKTPVEILQAYCNPQDPKPKGGHMRVYGCRAYPLIQNQPKLNKLDPRASIGYLVGYDSTNIFRIWVPSQQKVIRTRDVQFDESIMYNPHYIDPPLSENTQKVLQMIEIPPSGTDEAEDIEEQQPPVDQSDQINQSNQPDQSDQSNIQSKDTDHMNSYTQGLITPELTPQPEKSVRFSIQSQDTSPNSSRNPSTPPPNELSIVVDHTSHIKASPNSSRNSKTPLQNQFQMPALTISGQNPSISGLNAQEPSKTKATRDKSQGINTSNIIDQPRNRKPNQRKEAYYSALQSVSELTGYNTAFMAGSLFKDKARMHRSDLPDPPLNWRQLEHHKHADSFKQAAQKEYDELESRGTWVVVDQNSLPEHIKPIPLKWVFTYKFDTDGYLDRYKARLCARGDRQPVNIYQDNYAATLATRIFRAVMAIAARFDLNAEQVDAITAFINGTLDEEVYTHMPDGFKIPGKCLLLKRALYGLRRSPLIWLQEFSNTLIKLGLTPAPESPCLFTNGRIIVFFYVDDVVILYHKIHEAEYLEFKKALLNAYQFKDLGELKWFLGIRIIRDRANRRLWLCQDSYIEKLADSFKITASKAIKTPLAVEELLPNEGLATPQEIHAYQSRIGSTMYATTITRPDAARASNKLAEFLLNPSPAHLAAANRLITYLYNTRYYAIEYSYDRPNSSNPELAFRCATDAAFADNISTRRSTEGFIFKLFGGAIDWKSTRQKSVTTSSTEAELLALSHASSQIYWWKRFFTSIQLELEEYQVECDNQQTIRLLTASSIKLETKLKHIDIHHHWLRQEVQQNKLHLKWIPTTQMPADGLTKALPTQKHQEFVRQIGLIDIQHLI